MSEVKSSPYIIVHLDFWNWYLGCSVHARTQGTRISLTNASDIELVEEINDLIGLVIPLLSPNAMFSQSTSIYNML